MTGTIFALSSGHGRAGVAVVRVSGDCLGGLFNKVTKINEPAARHAYLTDLVDTDGAVIDKAIAVYFPAPNSFTGQDVIEFHAHGSPAVTLKLFQTLQSHGARMAEPGEFSRRAFDNNKMDLTEIDGLTSLLNARTDRQRALALRSMSGGDSAIYEGWRAQMISIAAHSAAILDYAADDLPANIQDTVVKETQKLHDEINSAISVAPLGAKVQSGFNIVLAGETNVGKSSLFNRIIGESRAIVSDIPGTTRDVVSTELDIDGYLVRLSDTAGLRETTDAIERVGIEKTNAEIENADLVIRVEIGDSKSEIRKNEILVINKSDLRQSRISNPEYPISVSALTGAGVPELMELIKQKIHAQLDGTESQLAVNARTCAHLTAARDVLGAAAQNADNMEIFAEHVRIAADEIGRILGIIGADEIMDAVFGGLCLGK